MNIIDYIILFFLVIGFLLGFRDGLVRKLIGIIGLVIGVALAFQFSEEVGKFIAPVLNDEIYLAEIVGGIFIFLLSVFVFSILKRLIHPLDKVNKFVNQIIGGVAGMLQILFFISGIFLLANIFHYPSNSDRNNSLFYSKVYNVIPYTIELVLGSNSKAKQWMHDYIQQKDELLRDSTINAGAQ